MSEANPLELLLSLEIGGAAADLDNHVDVIGGARLGRGRADPELDGGTPDKNDFGAEPFESGRGKLWCRSEFWIGSRHPAPQ